jgi:hypothetical protein
MLIFRALQFSRFAMLSGIAAVTGHKTLSEVQRYAARYDRRKLAVEAMRGEISDASTVGIKKTTA